MTRKMEKKFPPETYISKWTTHLPTKTNLSLLTRATTDQTTLVNPTHHVFFSLAGIANPTPSVENNILTLNADFIHLSMKCPSPQEKY